MPREHCGGGTGSMPSTASSTTEQAAPRPMPSDTASVRLLGRGGRAHRGLTSRFIVKEKGLPDLLLQNADARAAGEHGCLRAGHTHRADP